MSGEVLPNLLVKGTGLVAARYGTEITLHFSFSGGGFFYCRGWREGWNTVLGIV